jgi:biopolymer transport protein ExbB/TolQ
MKKIGVMLLFVVLGLSTYLIFWSQFEATKIKLFATIGILIGVFFVLSERITSVKTFFLEFKTEINEVRSNAKEIKEILANIKSQKDMIDLIARDANTAQKQMLEIETIANEAHIKAQKIEKILKDAESKEMRRKLKHISATGHED